MQINRLFEIIYTLLHKKKVSASIVGIPVYTEKGRGEGISLLPDFVLDKLP